MKEDTGVEVEGKTWLMAMRQLFTLPGVSNGQVSDRLPPRAGEDLTPRKQ